MSEHAIRPLGAATWDAFVDLAEKHNGVWNGCWCTWFHPACVERGQSPEGNRAYKERLVRLLDLTGQLPMAASPSAIMRWLRDHEPDLLTSQAVAAVQHGLVEAHADRHGDD